MFGYQIESVLKKFPEVHTHLIGLVSIDEIPQKLKKMHFIVVNESISSTEGSHWLIIMRDFDGTYILFDPLGT